MYTAPACVSHTMWSCGLLECSILCTQQDHMTTSYDLHRQAQYTQGDTKKGGDIKGEAHINKVI